MPIIEEFPKDDAYRLVKWVDKFTLPHLTTRSTSVTVRLQRVPFQRHSDLNRLTRESAVALLPLDPTDAGQAQYTSVAVHAGLLPHLAVGRVYQGQRLVGELPTRQATLTLADAELSCHEIKIGEELPAPAGWTYPYKQLLSREFGGIQTEFSGSRCLVFVDASGIEYVIPRALIFQRFYAIQRELANAFTSGPWAQTRHRIVYAGQLKSGLETRIDPATGAWHVILQTHVENDFARLAALLYFDDYAVARAESIYAGMLSDRRGNVHAPWFASAQIPFRAEAKPLRLQVKGFMLQPRLGRREGGGKPVVHKQSFLVTSILGSSWPSYTPPIKAGRLNSGDKGKEQLPAQGDRPYANHLHARPAGSELVTTSATDASAAQGDAVTLEDTFSWLDGEEPEKLTKDLSQLYSDSDLRPAPPPPDAASGGERTHQGGNAAPAHHKVLVRDPVNRFRYLLDAFELLHSAGDLQRYTVFQPAIPSQLAQCGGLSCWNFLDDMARRTGRWPSAGWRMLERARGVGTERTPGKPRCVLVVRIEVGTQLGYWFEIETRTTEGGVLSPLVASTGTDEQVAVSHLVESIARAEGRNLRQAMTAAAYEIGSDAAHCYKHHYKGDQNSEIDPNSLRRFLMRWSA
ncbi:hypothetical protein EBA17_01155 [Xanthomonas oryzae pv. oryzae]|uniref:hypothetical protein n=1 Tax=Xanthomonas oryzae TaxID=347 RepID=UPI001058754F|nr:hypothetical protein [Xanthomonas oryzae]QBN85525.1 hypothetical protein EBA17_01155 [Xanthomonas oryzae pv. oryzae]